MDNLIGQDYRNFDGKRKWELLFEDVFLVILDTNKKQGRDINLIGVDIFTLTVKWAVGGEIDSDNQYDGIVNIWIKDGAVWAGTWSGYEYRLNYQTGEIYEKHWRK